ncbi:MAG TPA: hypothetical protein VF658_09840 [Pyrinomonadaceae bacterium]|jgi:hypothetical protein
MIDEKLLDRMNFGQLNQSLDYVLEKMEQIDDECSDGEDEPRLDMLCLLANKIIMQMDAIIRQNDNPKALAQWNKAMANYKQGFQKFSDILDKENKPAGR